MEDLIQHQHRLQDIVDDLLTQAKQAGADSAEAAVNVAQGISVNVRKGETETLERQGDQGLGLTVYFGQRKGSASTTSLTDDAIKDTVEAACAIARHTSEDQYAGLPDAELLATDIPDLDLYHPWRLSAEEAADLAIQCEAAAIDLDPRINNSEGASLSSRDGLFVYANSLDFLAGYPTSRHSLSCAVIAEATGNMERDYWFDSARDATHLASAVSIGEQAGKRAIARLGSKKLSTRTTPVIFINQMATGLLRSFTAAINGHAQYRQSSFLLGAVGETIFPEWMQIRERPLIPGGLGSAPFDNEGIATQESPLLKDGRIERYVLDTYAARKLGLQSTGNAGGTRNIHVAPSPDRLDFDGLLKLMGTGLVVTEMMGQGINPVTGDYSRGAAGFWVENGEINHPVQEITVAGNLRDMFGRLVAVGTDNEFPGSTDTGSWLIEGITIAGS